MASMYEIEKMIEDIIRRVTILAEAVGVNTEPEAPVITEEQTDPDA